jgi:hypothetical protein
MPAHQLLLFGRRQRFEGASDAAGPLLDVLDPPDRPAAHDRDRRRKIRPLAQLTGALPGDPKHLGQLSSAGQPHQLRHAAHPSNLTSCHLPTCHLVTRVVI